MHWERSVATIADVARKAGASNSTAWHVLNGPQRSAQDPACVLAAEAHGDRLILAGNHFKVTRRPVFRRAILALTHFLRSLHDVWRFDWGRINAIQQAFHRSSLVPRGFVVESVCCEGNRTVITVRASGRTGSCPSCGTVSRRVHSRYRRRVTDLPLSGRIVQLLVNARPRLKQSCHRSGHCNVLLPYIASKNS